jgi:hypothetical protein
VGVRSESPGRAVGLAKAGMGVMVGKGAAPSMLLRKKGRAARYGKNIKTRMLTRAWESDTPTRDPVRNAKPPNNRDTKKTKNRFRSEK